MIINESELVEFINKYGKVRARTAITIREGYASCIPPVPTICGAELYCSEASKAEIEAIIKDIGE